MKKKPINKSNPTPIFPPYIPSPYTYYWDKESLSYYIFKEREKNGRKSTRKHDYYTAEYILKLNDYISKKAPAKVFNISNETEREEAIWCAFNIFDQSFFNKMNTPQYSDLECFLQAERCFCKEKELDHIAYHEFLSRKRGGHTTCNDKEDYIAAEKKYRKNMIKRSAYNNYLYRKKNGISGNEKLDYDEAQAHFEEEDFKETIATICWDLASHKEKHQNIYWFIACEIFDELNSINYPWKTPKARKDKTIIQKIKDKLAVYGL